MLNALLDLFKKPQTKHSEHSLALASAALLVEIMRADHEIDESEKVALINALQSSLKLTLEEAEELMQDAMQLTDAANDLHQFTKIIHAQSNNQQKFELMCNLWRVAYASDGIDKYEEHMIRRISELLYIPHAEFIRAKLLVRDSQPQS